MQPFFFLTILAAVAVMIKIIQRKESQLSGMEDTPVSADSVRKGISERWYTATLTRVNGQAAVRLTARMANGEKFTDTYPMSESDWQQLFNEGYPHE